MKQTDPIGLWSQNLADQVITPLAPDRMTAIAAAAVSAGAVAAVGGVAVAAAGTHLIAKVIAIATLVTTIGGGVAAVTGSLPDPIQTWVADLGDSIGIDLPRPEIEIPVLPTVPTTLPLPNVTVPTLPTLPTVPVTLPELPPITIP